jgi:hypothetical protein
VTDRPPLKYGPELWCSDGGVGWSYWDLWIKGPVVAAMTTVTATFSEAVQGVSGTTSMLKAGSTAVAATVGYDAITRTATLGPTSELTSNAQYTAQADQ